MTTIHAQAPTDSVAAYATVQGAERAVAHLVSIGFDEHQVGIAPRDFESIDRHPLRRLLGQWLRRGAIAGATAMAIVALARELDIDTVTGSVVPLVAWGAVGGLIAGLVMALLVHRHRRAKTALAPPEAIAPTRFEVVVDQDRERARHGLARWWDPAAPPAGWQEPS